MIIYAHGKRRSDIPSRLTGLGYLSRQQKVCGLRFVKDPHCLRFITYDQ